TFPEDIGGGEEGAKEAQEHPNREAYFIIGAVGVALIMLIAIIGLLFISCCTCCTKKSKGTKKKNGRKHKSSENKDRQGNSEEGAGVVFQQEDDTVGGYGQSHYDSESESEVDPDFKLNESDYDEDGNPKASI
ncbi:unnamed protein product, partial [Rodentolepis nana]|uniref:Bravo_FIGEY domain-containing protein n=1 Tax=Rodentolepis nana TaxID=102285 RepID=A0A0R3THM9_RODNA